MGLKKSKSGNILVFGNAPGTRDSGIPGPIVGYMPQERAVNLNLSLMELFYFFGLMFGLTSNQIEQKSRMFLEILNLPRDIRPIRVFR